MGLVMDADRIATIRRYADQHLPLPSQNVKELLDALETAQAELAGWHAECDSQGVPYNPPVLVRHHRNNAAFAASMNASTEMFKEQKAKWESERDAVQAENTRLTDRVRQLGRVNQQQAEGADRLTNQITDLKNCLGQLLLSPYGYKAQEEARELLARRSPNEETT